MTKYLIAFQTECFDKPFYEFLTANFVDQFILSPVVHGATHFDTREQAIRVFDRYKAAVGLKTAHGFKLITVSDIPDA